MTDEYEAMVKWRLAEGNRKSRRKSDSQRKSVELHSGLNPVLWDEKPAGARAVPTAQHACSTILPSKYFPEQSVFKKRRIFLAKQQAECNYISVHFLSVQRNTNWPSQGVSSGMCICLYDNRKQSLGFWQVAFEDTFTDIMRRDSEDTRTAY
jgi:hypothetical protein